LRLTASTRSSQAFLVGGHMARDGPQLAGVFHGRVFSVAGGSGALPSSNLVVNGPSTSSRVLQSDAAALRGNLLSPPSFCRLVLEW